MALNFMGLGFSFGAKDKGLLGMQDKISAGFEAVSRAVRGVGDATKSMLGQLKMQTFLQSVGMLKDKIGDIASSAETGINLSTSLESQMASMGKEARAMGANFGFTGDELKDFTGKAAGMAYSLNTDVKTAAESLRAFKEAGDELRALGLEGAKDVARFAEGFGVSADLIRNQTMRMTREVGLSEEGVAQFVGSLHAMGVVQGDIGAAFNQMKEFTDLMQQRRLLGDSPEQAKAFAQQTMALSAGMFKFSQDSDVAREKALGLANAMTEQRQQFQDMLAGEGKQLPEMLSRLTSSTGDVQFAMDALKQGPAEFGIALNKLVKNAGGWEQMLHDQPGAVNYLRTQMQKAFGEEIGGDFLMFLEHADDKTLDLMSSIQTATVDLGKLGREAHSSGLTLQERYDRAIESFEHGFRKIARPAAREFVRDSAKEFKKFNQRLTEIVKEGGPMGGLIEKLSEVHQIGVQAFIPKTLQPMSILFGRVVGEIAPALTALGAMGIKLDDLISPWGALTAVMGIGLIRFADLKAQGKTTSEALEIMVEDVKKVARVVGEVLVAAFDMAVDALSELGDYLYRQAYLIEWVFGGWENFWDNLIADFVGEAKGAPGRMAIVWDEILAVFDPTRGAKTKVGKAIELFVETFRMVFGGLYRSLAKLDWGSVMGRIGDFLGKAFVTLVNFVANLPWVGIAKALFGVVYGGLKLFGLMLQGIDWESIGMALRSAGQQLMTFIGDGVQRALPLVVSYYTTVSGALKALVSKIPWQSIFDTAFGTVESVLGFLLSDAVEGAISKVVVALLSAAGTVGQALITFVNSAFAFLGGLDLAALYGTFTEMAIGVAFSALYAVLPFVQSLLGQIPIWANQALEIILGFFGNLGPIVSGIADTLGDELRSFLPTAMPILIDFALSAWKFLFVDAPLKVIKYIPSLFAMIPELAWAGIKLVGDLVIGVLKGITEWFERRFPAVGAVMRNVVTKISDSWDGLKESVGLVFDFMNSLLDTWKQGWQAFSDWLTGIWNWLFGESIIPDWFASAFAFMGEVLDSFLSFFSEIITTLVEGASTHFTALKELITDVASSFQTAFFNAINWLATLPEWVSSSVQAYIVQPISDALSTIGDWVTGTFITPVISAGAAMYNAAVGFIGQFLEGLEKKWEDVKNFLTEKLDGLMEYLPWSSPPEDSSSPLSKLSKVGGGFVGELLLGFQESWPTLTTWMSASLAMLRANITTGLSGMGGSPDSPGEPLKVPLQVVVSEPDPTLSRIISDDTNTAMQIWSLWQTGMIGITSAFTNSMASKFEGLATDIQVSWGTAWGNILDMTDTAVTAIMADLDSARMALAALERIASSAQELQAGVEAAVTPTPAEVPPLDGLSIDEAMYQAIHFPKWYEDYKVKFERLIAAVEASGAKATPRKQGARLKTASSTARESGAFETGVARSGNMTRTRG